MTQLPDKSADTSVEVSPLIAARWSPRALDPTGEVTDAQLRALLEAARWAPSYGNTQPARYLLGRRGDDTFDRIFGVLNSGNKAWTHAASVLLLGVVVLRNNKGDIPLTEYGLGLASENLVLQAVAEGLVAHQMGGFDADAAREVFALPDDVRPIVAIAVGQPGDPDQLDERRRERELAPRTRLALGEIAFTGEWGRPAF
ncbi:MAG TPA: nitroreductase family protein [Pseudonocardiaceae bacterium]|nr:nitroreductase family protein [Pseudonocardiaceae bacterium]